MGWDPIGDISDTWENKVKKPLSGGSSFGTPIGGLPEIIPGAGAGMTDLNNIGPSGVPNFRAGMPMDTPANSGAHPETPEERAKREYADKLRNLEGDVASFRWHSPGRRMEFARETDTDVRRQLSGQLAKTNLEANRRGLLGSGLQKADEAQAIGTAGGAYAKETARYNKYDDDLMKAYDEALIQAKQTKYKDDQQAAQDAYNEAVKKANQWEQARGSIFQGLGSILGGFLGGRSG